MEQLYGLEVEIVAEDTLRTPQENIRVLLFQIVRELLFNIVKHADTGRARVALRQLNDHVEIVVSDAGKGFDVAAVEAREADDVGFGLFSVGERLGLFGGHMEIESSPGTGTRVRIDVPLELA
jgi:signal transduction histidine kinase